MLTSQDKKQKGYAILFTIVVTGIIISLTIGMTNIAFRHRVFSKEAVDSSKSLFAADTGLECLTAMDNNNLFEDYGSTSTVAIDCGGLASGYSLADGTVANPDGSFTYTSPLVSADFAQNFCMKITVTKNIPAGTDINGQPIYATSLESVGYNKNCTTTQNLLNSNNDNNLLVERKLTNTYTRGN